MSESKLRKEILEIVNKVFNESELKGMKKEEMKKLVEETVDNVKNSDITLLSEDEIDELLIAAHDYKKVYYVKYKGEIIAKFFKKPCSTMNEWYDIFTSLLEPNQYNKVLENKTINEIRKIIFNNEYEIIEEDVKAKEYVF